MSGRYLLKIARGETKGNLPDIQQVIEDIPDGYGLHSITPCATGSGYVGSFLVVFEREPEGRYAKWDNATGKWIAVSTSDPTVTDQQTGRRKK